MEESRGGRNTVFLLGWQASAPPPPHSPLHTPSRAGNLRPVPNSDMIISQRQAGRVWVRVFVGKEKDLKRSSGPIQGRDRQTHASSRDSGPEVGLGGREGAVARKGVRRGERRAAWAGGGGLAR